MADRTTPDINSHVSRYDWLPEIQDADYDFEPLPGPGWHRVLCLLPAASDDDPIHFLLVTRSPDDPALHCAVSYTWGGQQRDRIAYCGGRRMRITQNCYTILLQLRRVFHLQNLEELLQGHPGGACFWIDQICINQDSCQDRNVSVANMGFIYKNAPIVIIWLGFLDDEVQQFLIEVAGPGISGEPTSKVFEHLLLKGGAAATHGKREWPENDLVKHMRKLRANPWFQRMWTFQEFVLPDWRQSILLLPDTLLSIYKIDDELQTSDAAEFSPFVIDSILSRVARAEGPCPLPFNFRSVIGRCVDRDCYDPRDKIFALRAVLAHGGQNFGVKSINTLPGIDYSKSVAEVFTEWSSWAVADVGCLQLLYTAPVCHSEQLISPDQSVLPSWVPDFANLAKLRRSKNIEAWWHVYEPPWDDFSASGSVSNAIPPIITERFTLQLTGQLFDTVNKLSTELPSWNSIQGNKLPAVTNTSARSKLLSTAAWLDTVRRFVFTPREPRSKTFEHAGCSKANTPGEDASDRSWDKPSTDNVSSASLDVHDTCDKLFGWMKCFDGDEASPLLSMLQRSLADEAVDSDIFNTNAADKALFMARFSLENGVAINERAFYWFTCMTHPTKSVPTFDNLFAAMSWTERCHLLRTHGGRYGLGFGTIQTGDVCAVVSGLERVLILHPVGQHYRLVGHAYIDGVMDGEIWPDDQKGLQQIEII